MIATRLLRVLLKSAKPPRLRGEAGLVTPPGLALDERVPPHVPATTGHELGAYLMTAGPRSGRRP